MQSSVDAQLAQDEHIARMMQSADEEALWRRPRSRRPIIDDLLRESFVSEEVQIVMYPLPFHPGSAPVAGPASDAIARALASAPPLLATGEHHHQVVSLLRSTFSNVSTKTLFGHAAVVLLDEFDHRLKRTNSHHRTRSTEVETFDKVVCACVFDVQVHDVKGEPQTILRISYCATEERFGGRGFATLLLAHIKVVAAKIARQLNRETTIIVLSLEHTIPFWCSPEMGFMQGGHTAMVLQTLNMTDTALCTQTIPLGTHDRLMLSRLTLASSTRQKLRLPAHDLRVFPRFPQRKSKRDAKKGGTRSDEAERRKKDAPGDGEDGDGDDMDVVVHRHHHDQQRESAAACTYHFLSGPPLPTVALPYQTNAHEWESFWPILHYVMKRRCSCTLTGRPPTQHLHTDASQFIVGEELVAAVQEATLSKGREEYRLERAQMMSPCATNKYCWNVKLIDRSPSSLPPPPPYVRRLRHRVVASPPPPPIICAIVPICFLFKTSSKPCPIHQDRRCCE